MQLILGDIKWLTDDMPKVFRQTPVVIQVTDGVKVIELPITEVRMEQQLTITCSLPEA